MLEVPSIGTLQGDGVIGANNSLDFKMAAKLAGAGGLLGKITSISGPSQNNKGIPFLIKGTTSNPVFMPALGGLAGNALQNVPGAGQGQQGLGGLLGGFLNKKKK